MPSHPHPLAPLSEAEFQKTRDIVRALHGPDTSILFRAILLDEPAKDILVPYLEAEHAGKLDGSVPVPPRQVLVEHDLITPPANHQYIRTVVNVDKAEVVSQKVAGEGIKPYLAGDEIGDMLLGICLQSDLYREAMSEFAIPDGFEVTIDPWPYGGAEQAGEPRYIQGLVFAKDTTTGNPDSNHYSFPIPIVPVMDFATREIIRVDRLATGGAGDSLAPAARAGEPRKLHNSPQQGEYVPELRPEPRREGLKPLNVVQPEGPSFTPHADGLVEWQKWRFRVGFTPREGAVLHDVCYDGRPVAYRLSFSELTVPYGDPRPPYHRKQAFDFGDTGVGRAVNNLSLGCDCLGAIHYMDTLLTAPDGSANPSKSVICLHEQDNGVLWKHTNFRTGRGVVTRMRELVVQFIATLANYEYIFIYKLDLSGALTFETRATGIMSVVSIDEGKTSAYGNVVGPGVLAQNHQHVFAIRIDPAIDSYGPADTQVVIEESVGRRIDPDTNPFGNLYEIERRTVERAAWVDADSRRNRTLRLENRTRLNPVSGKNVGFKIISPETQLLLADPDSTQAKRAPFAQHHFWVTGYRDGELWAAGEFTNQTAEEIDGVGAMVERGDWFTDGDAGDKASAGGRRSSPVVWTVFGLTHNPRVEDWPVMPVEVHQVHLRPADFFTSNPALDVPSDRNQASVRVGCCAKPE
ncbi:primary-amine oxidase [Geosmithia morbida]|uniref:Amine oxidase n=1 Tax=Geosmithia morbida TaxID=1094350 RepID=A0A9P5D5B3_9HYPO|nr:primary-amine oxidase [Geosmithia morbida]KAF4124381.1 primary-amine oxidase [Geosmithia morbida]